MDKHNIQEQIDFLLRQVEQKTLEDCMHIEEELPMDLCLVMLN